MDTLQALVWTQLGAALTLAAAVVVCFWSLSESGRRRDVAPPLAYRVAVLTGAAALAALLSAGFLTRWLTATP